MKLVEKEEGVNFHEMEPGDRVRMFISDKDYIEVSISTEEPDSIEVRVCDGVVVIRPHVTNKVVVSLETHLDRMKRDGVT